MEEKKLYPMKIVPREIELPWGVFTHIVADLGYEESKIGSGYLAGDNLDDVMETYFERVVGDDNYNFYGRQFPLSVASLDVKNGFSPLTVCPADELASERYDALGKKKLWYVAEARPDATVCIGFKQELDAAMLYEACADASVMELLHQEPAHKGDFFVIEPGTVHAAKNVKLIEVSEASGLDFAIFGGGSEDFTSEDSLVEALDFINLKPWKDDHEHHHAHADQDRVTRTLEKCDEFAATEIHLSDALHIYTEQFGSFIVYTCLSGEVSFQFRKDGPTGMDTYLLAAGETLLIPAELPDFFIVPIDRSSVLVEATVPPREMEDSYLPEEHEHHHHHDHDCDCDDDDCDCDHDHCDHCHDE